MWDLLFNWGVALELGTDVIAYLLLALVGTVFFLLRLFVALFFGGGDGVDDGMDLSDSDGSFTFFSTLSVLAFFMGAGWMGLSCRVDWGLGSFASAASAAAFGFGMMLLASGLMVGARKLNRTIEFDLQTAVGRTGKVYLPIPKRGDGSGQVEVSVSGRRKILDAISTKEKIESFRSVVVKEVRDDGTLIVEHYE